jgi:hypothetical protein
MELPNVLFRDGVVVLGGHVAALLVVVHTLFAIARNHLLPEQLDRLVRHLPLPSPLLDGLQVRDRVLGPSPLFRFVIPSFFVIEIIIIIMKKIVRARQNARTLIYIRIRSFVCSFVHSLLKEAFESSHGH